MRKIQFDQCSVGAQPITLEMPNPDNPVEAQHVPGVMLTITDPAGGAIYAIPMPKTDWDQLHAQASGILIANGNLN